MWKDSEGTSKTPILEALTRKSKLPALHEEQDGVLYQTMLNLNKKHQHNLNARKKTNDAARQAQLERE